jgi:prevent-host-death family protein
MASSETFSASEFKAKCLDILDRVGRREWQRVVVTKRGRAVALLIPPPAEKEDVEKLPGFLRGSVVIPPEVDLTAPVADEGFVAEDGELHR